MKMLWLIVPPAFVLRLVALILRYRLMSNRAKDTDAGTLAYTVTSDETGGLRIYPHGGIDAAPNRRAAQPIWPSAGKVSSRK